MFDKIGRDKITRKEKKEKRKGNRTQQRVRNNTPSLRGEPLDPPRCFGDVRSWSVEFA